MTDVSKGPFAVDKAPLGSTKVNILDATGRPFVHVHMKDCAGGDLAAAKARATRIAESLNKTEGHAP
jgi:hypothetical protein